ncbi:RING finger containing E3 ubiquitin-protein like [Actinidia chinensis var. chinensis]|uniref:RING finger containing E3 ubiquitin-protein like n=1 Tax=Actinidia chinensis var. chinensis TaxID=1590841 RepID=A0A2R6RD93_ACTCC|nr:RING finger containing E3 ubiquitin-protein like [Actinidia chinensis var. chinensis]
MSLEDCDLLDDGNGDGGGKSSSVSCSICLEVVADNGDRSWAKLQCSHQFHLDCIGSAFNTKGAMQCPNCRKIEKGQWLYASGCHPVSELNMDDWAHDEDLYDLSYSEMSFGVHWCPFSGLTRLHSSFDDGEFSSTAYRDLLGQHTLFAEHTAVSSATHPCPYIAYLGPIHPSSSNSGGSVSDGSTFSNHWNGPSVPREMPSSFVFPAMDVHYQGWEHHSSPFPTSSSRVGGADQPSVPSVTHRAARSNPDIQRSGFFMHPFLVGHSSAARVGSSVASSMIPPYPSSVARARDRVQALQAYFHQPSNSRTPLIPAARRSTAHRPIAQVGPVASFSDQTGGFYFFPSASSGRNFQEAENPPTNRFQAWERDHLTSFPLSQADRDPGWGAFHQTAGGSDTAIRPASFRQRHGSERMPSQNRS